MFVVFNQYPFGMRSSKARELANEANGDLLTTGEAARALGVSRQHVVDLCDAGDLPHTLVGKHRRIARSDVEALRTGRTRMNKQDAQSLLLAYAIAGEVVRDPVATLDKARANLRSMLQAPHAGATRVWLREWDNLLNGSTVDLLLALTANSQRSRELRQNSPFAGVLSQEVRQRALQLASTARTAK